MKGDPGMMGFPGPKGHPVSNVVLATITKRLLSMLPNFCCVQF